MISRRRILFRSTDNLDEDPSNKVENEDDDDVWQSEEKLLKDHIQEVLAKWDQIDDEIWGKIVCMERNRRVAKAYARAPILTINGSYIGFDGFRIGLNGFNNPMRDTQIEEIKNQIGSGAKIKIDDEGNIMIKRIGKQKVFVKIWQKYSHRENCVDDELIKTKGQLEMEKGIKLFDMDKFLTNVSNELKNAYPDRRNLESQCISCVAFVKECQNVLQMPIWIMIINIVALDLLKMKLPQSWKNCSVPNLSLKHQSDCDENDDHHHIDHYKCSANRLTLRRWRSMTPNFKGPKLPPRDYERDDKIKKLRDELKEVKIKIEHIEDFYGRNALKSRTTKETCSQNQIQNTKESIFQKGNSNSSKGVFLHYDSGLESDPYGDNNNAIYGIHETKPMQINDIYDNIWQK